MLFALFSSSSPCSSSSSDFLDRLALGGRVASVFCRRPRTHIESTPAALRLLAPSCRPTAIQLLVEGRRGRQLPKLAVEEARSRARRRIVLENSSISCTQSS
ncbi:hypothetical protein FA95DRAFT_1567524 [Auriscalpium vulgare]|uniref:Uncharacterized protein n=1 Tax=Auriscalpium vulgare TaxID=40419 RepID=A0ACB8R4M6_9AGAM|nr:hypothetical protein FA95DRAFT_1567524 [Auriscalpium vulgare]